MNVFFQLTWVAHTRIRKLFVAGSAVEWEWHTPKPPWLPVVDRAIIDRRTEVSGWGNANYLLRCLILVRSSINPQHSTKFHRPPYCHCHQWPHRSTDSSFSKTHAYNYAPLFFIFILRDPIVLRIRHRCGLTASDIYWKEDSVRILGSIDNATETEAAAAMVRILLLQVPKNTSSSRFRWSNEEDWW